MREIKFRGKRVDNGEWVYGDLIHGVDVAEGKFYILPQNYVFVPKEGNWIEDCEVIPETVGQFTGLYDKKGVEIYDGDIVKMTEIDEDSACGREIKTIAEVVFGQHKNAGCISDYPASFCLYSKKFYREHALLYNSRYEYEIIGNVTDNPELLEETK